MTRESQDLTAEQELVAFLEEGEHIEAIVFGEWGWGNGGAPDPTPVPEDKQGVVLSWNEAWPLMRTWRFSGGFGCPDCYAIRCWTNRRVIWVTQYDGSTWLSSAPRNPVAHMPDMPGG